MIQRTGSSASKGGAGKIDSVAASDDDELASLRFGDGPQVAVAVHGMTASAMAWSVVARALPREWTLVAPDLRGRGRSADLPGPYGLDRHADDICALARALDDEVVLIGHSIGAYAALLAAAAHPDLFTRLILIDGGPSMPLPAHLDPDTVLDATLGPAIDRLRRTYPSEEEYLEVFRTHPTLAETWGPDLEAYARYDIAGGPGVVRSRVGIEAVRQDGREALTRAADFAAAWDTLAIPTLLALAPKGMLGKPPGLLPAQAVADAHQRRPDIPVETIAEANHSTLILDPRYATTVARRISDPASWPRPRPRAMSFQHSGRRFILTAALTQPTRFRYTCLADHEPFRAYMNFHGQSVRPFYSGGLVVKVTDVSAFAFTLASRSPGPSSARSLAAMKHVDKTVPFAAPEGIVLRYGRLCGPGASDVLLDVVRKRQVPVIGGTRIWSFRLTIETPSTKRRDHARGTRELDDRPGPGAGGSNALTHDILPAIRSAPGFVAGYWLEPVDGHGFSFVVFETEEQARRSASPASNWAAPGVSINDVDVRRVAASA
jgi:lipase